MRKIKLFEEYREDLHKYVNKARSFVNTNVGKSIVRIVSFIDDIIHFDFDMIPYSLKNKSGYNKLEELVNELGILKLLIRRTNGDLDFEDMYKYGLNDKVLLYIEDEDVKEYLQKDIKLFNRLYTNEYIDLFTKYSEWKSQNGINESYNFKTINYYSCNNCDNLFKSKNKCTNCSKCRSNNISSMDEVDWYKQAD